MENSEKHNENLGGKNKRKNDFQQTDVGNSGRHLYPQTDYYVVHKDQFKSFIQHITGNQSNASRPPVPVQVSLPIPPSQALYNAPPGHTLQPIIGPPLVHNSQSNMVECPMSTSMKNFQDSLRLNIGNSGGNQFQPYFPQSQVFNNTSIQYHQIIQSQEHYLHLNASSQFVNGFPSTQTNVSNHSMSLNVTNPTFHVNTSDQLVNGFPSSPKSQAKATRLQKIWPPPLSIVRPTIPVKVPAPIPPSQAPYDALSGHPVQPITCPPIVDNSHNNLVNSSTNDFSINFPDPTMNFGNSRGNQFELYPPQPQVFKNINVQNNPTIQSQEHYYSMNGINQNVNGFHSSETTGSSQLVNGLPLTQTNVSNPPVSLNASNPTFHANDNNHLENGFPSSQINDPLSSTSEFMLPSPKSNMNFLSPRSPYRPLLSPSLFSSPSSPEYPFYSLLIPDPPSPLSSSLFPFTTSPERPNSQ